LGFTRLLLDGGKVWPLEPAVLNAMGYVLIADNGSKPLFHLGKHDFNVRDSLAVMRFNFSEK
jgi:hypothetical protein